MMTDRRNRRAQDVFKQAEGCSGLGPDHAGVDLCHSSRTNVMDRGRKAARRLPAARRRSGEGWEVIDHFVADRLDHRADGRSRKRRRSCEITCDEIPSRRKFHLRRALLRANQPIGHVVQSRGEPRQPLFGLQASGSRRQVAARKGSGAVSDSRSTARKIARARPPSLPRRTQRIEHEHEHEHRVGGSRASSMRARQAGAGQEGRRRSAAVPRVAGERSPAPASVALKITPDAVSPDAGTRKRRGRRAGRRGASPQTRRPRGYRSHRRRSRDRRPRPIARRFSRLEPVADAPHREGCGGAEGRGSIFSRSRRTHGDRRVVSGVPREVLTPCLRSSLRGEHAPACDARMPSRSNSLRVSRTGSPPTSSTRLPRSSRQFPKVTTSCSPVQISAGVSRPGGERRTRARRPLAVRTALRHIVVRPSSRRRRCGRSPRLCSHENHFLSLGRPIRIQPTQPVDAARKPARAPGAYMRAHRAVRRFGSDEPNRSRKTSNPPRQPGAGTAQAWGTHHVAKAFNLAPRGRLSRKPIPIRTASHRLSRASWRPEVARP